MENPIKMDDLGVPLFFGNDNMSKNHIQLRLRPKKAAKAAAATAGARLSPRVQWIKTSPIDPLDHRFNACV